jgi:hypothetical protein
VRVLRDRKRPSLVPSLAATYTSFMTVLMGFVIGHSVKEDLVAKNAQQ